MEYVSIDVHRRDSSRLPRFLGDAGAAGGRAKTHFEPPSFEASEPR
jgi:hypothetical protein